MRLSNTPSVHAYVVQGYMAGIILHDGWMDTRHGGDTLDAAEAVRHAFIADDSHWCNPARATREDRERMTRVVRAKWTEPARA